MARVHRVCDTAVFWGCSGTLGVAFGMQTVLRGTRGANFNVVRAILEPLGVILARSWAPKEGVDGKGVGGTGP